MRRILITGSNGLLGQTIVRKLISNPDFILFGLSKGENRVLLHESTHSIQDTLRSKFSYLEVDICNPQAVMKAFEECNPDIVIHTAAMTNVDACELDKTACMELNVHATQSLLKASERSQAHFIHLSTDFIFDGLEGPYKEEAVPNPLSFYGSSKVDAENLVMKYPFNWSVVRTVLVYGVVPGLSRSNIVLWAKEALGKGKPINVVDDQFRTPTFVEDLAEGCILIAKMNQGGIFNISGEEYMSIVELVDRVAKFFNLPPNLIHPISSITLNQAAKRPAKTGFIIDKAKKTLGFRPHSFEEGLSKVASQLRN